MTKIRLLPWLAGLLAMNVQAAELLHGEVKLDDGATTTFSLSGESREDVIDGEIRLGEQAFRITKTSRLGLIGATRSYADDTGPVAEFAIFSSSFSEQTATGTPWVAADRRLHCDQPYNSFLVVYRMTDGDRIAALGSTPYPELAEGKVPTDSATVYCFFSRPPETS